MQGKYLKYLPTRQSSRELFNLYYLGLGVHTRQCSGLTPGGARGTKWDASNQTQVGHVHGKCPRGCIIFAAPFLKKSKHILFCPVYSFLFFYNLWGGSTLCGAQGYPRLMAQSTTGTGDQCWGSRRQCMRPDF